MWWGVSSSSCCSKSVTWCSGVRSRVLRVLSREQGAVFGGRRNGSGGRGKGARCCVWKKQRGLWVQVMRGECGGGCRGARVARSPSPCVRSRGWVLRFEAWGLELGVLGGLWCVPCRIEVLGFEFGVLGIRFRGLGFQRRGGCGGGCRGARVARNPSPGVRTNSLISCGR